MLVREEELSRRFARCTDEELECVLTAGLARYSPDELAAAEGELSRRPPSPPPSPQDVSLWLPSVEPAGSHAQGPPRPKSPYLFIDLLFDACLIAFGAWAVLTMGKWMVTLMPGPWWLITFYFLSISLINSLVALRGRWRGMKWRD